MQTHLGNSCYISLHEFLELIHMAADHNQRQQYDDFACRVIKNPGKMDDSMEPYDGRQPDQLYPDAVSLHIHTKVLYKKCSWQRD